MSGKSKPFAPILDEDIVEESNSKPYSLSASGNTFNFQGIAGEYKLTNQGLHLNSTAAGNLRCRLQDLDFDNSTFIGSGSSGKVVELCHKPSGRLIAAKKIPIADERQFNEIKRELDTLYPSQSQTCPNVVAFYGAFYDKGEVLIALEKMDGSLEDPITKLNTTIEETVIRAMTKQVLYGLLYLHKSLHVAHRDVKPSNILFSKDGWVKLTDFGISCSLLTTQMEMSTFVGTIIYMSPERMEGSNYNVLADIWSLGISLIQIATGEHPYARIGDKNAKMTFWEVLRRVGIMETPKLPEDKPFSKNFRDFISHCLQLPDQRWSAEQLLKHPFVSEISDEDSRLIVEEWLQSGILKSLMGKRQKQQTCEQRGADLMNALLQSGVVPR